MLYFELFGAAIPAERAKTFLEFLLALRNSRFRPLVQPALFSQATTLGIPARLLRPRMRRGSGLLIHQHPKLIWGEVFVRGDSAFLVSLNTGHLRTGNLVLRSKDGGLVWVDPLEVDVTYIGPSSECPDADFDPIPLPPRASWKSSWNTIDTDQHGSTH